MLPTNNTNSSQSRTMSIASVLDPTQTSAPSSNAVAVPSPSFPQPTASPLPPPSQSLPPASSVTPILSVSNGSTPNLGDDEESKKAATSSGTVFGTNPPKNSIGVNRRREDGAPQSSTNVPNLIYQCDSCGKQPLQGYRFRCGVCSEFDLCEECMTSGKHDSSHPFQKFAIQEIIKSPISRTSSLTGLPIEGRPVRRSSTKSGIVENSIEKMDDILAKCHINPLPASYTSTTVASQFLELYEAGLAAMEHFKKGKTQEQITARIAIALVGIPLRIRRGGNFAARTLPHPLEQETVSGVMACLAAQLLVLDSEKLFCSSTKTSSDLPSSDPMDLEKLSQNVFKGTFFKRVENPEGALSSFQKHCLRVWQNITSPRAEEQAPKFEKLVRQALEELRDALGLAEEPIAKDDIEEENGSKSKKRDRSSSGVSKKEKDRKKKRREDQDEVESLAGTQQHSIQPVSAAMRPTMSTESEAELRGAIKRLKEDVEEAHARIDVLIQLLREKVANPLVRGLDRAGR